MNGLNFIINHDWSCMDPDAGLQQTLKVAGYTFRIMSEILRNLHTI